MYGLREIRESGCGPAAVAEDESQGIKNATVLK